jgi:hypothetical protein
MKASANAESEGIVSRGGAGREPIVGLDIRQPPHK